MENKIWILRQTLEMRQGDVAKLIGVSQATICSWERGNTFPPVTAGIKLQKLFGVPLEEIFPEEIEK